MTGFGKAEGVIGGNKVTIEVRSLNSKGMDLNLRLPNSFKEMDGELRKEIGAVLVRGKVDCNINVENNADQDSAVINKELAKKYLLELKELADEAGVSSNDLLSVVMRMPEVIDTPKNELDENDKKALVELLRAALLDLNDFREKEGAELKQEFTLRITEIRAALAEVPKYENTRIEIVRERMRKALEDLNGHDENRFEQELIFYIEKMDISEEKMRLLNHLGYFEETMLEDEPGKKLGFISQEIGREINTLGSKSYHADMQKLVIAMKDALEKIKEQILNTL
ncbi:MAG: YicC family protein [Bacteroidetes bacterium]|nr:MAG: YicC family protein [Bacteroidota bacterium]TNE98114.1 MAG: YicC family protein [Bacteroidota bacterium]